MNMANSQSSEVNSLVKEIEEYTTVAKTAAEEAKSLAGKAAASALTAAKSAEAAAASNPLISSVIASEKKGKPLGDYLDDYYFFTGKTSEINRSLALAGIAIIWFFRNSTPGQPLFSNALLWPLICLVASLALDLVQYVLGSLFWGAFYRVNLNKWKKGKISNVEVNDVEAPDALSATLTIVFSIKIIFMIVAYVQLFMFLFNATADQIPGK